LYYFIVLLCVSVVSRPSVVYFVLMWHDIAYLCWKCR